jgi:hypothetical protein
MYGHYHDPDQKERTWKEKEAYGAYRVYTEKNIENLPWKIGEERKTRIFQLWRRIDVPLIFIIKAISISLQSQKYYSYEWNFLHISLQAYIWSSLQTPRTEDLVLHFATRQTFL